jgi:hypothetical protein
VSAEPTTHRVTLPHRRLLRHGAICERCTGRARWGTPAGTLCCACRGVLDRQAAERLHTLAAGYGVDPDQLLHSLVTEHGEIRMAPAGQGISQVHYLPDWRAAAEAVFADGGHRAINRQCRTVGRILWAVGLHIGARLAEGRDAYQAREIPWEMVDWAMQARSHMVWLMAYASELLRIRAEQPGADGAAISPTHQSLSWLVELLHAEVRQHPSLMPPILRAPREWPPVPTHPAAMALRTRRAEEAA